MPSGEEAEAVDFLWVASCKQGRHRVHSRGDEALFRQRGCSTPSSRPAFLAEEIASRAVTTFRRGVDPRVAVPLSTTLTTNGLAVLPRRGGPNRPGVLAHDSPSEVFQQGAQIVRSLVSQLRTVARTIRFELVEFSRATPLKGERRDPDIRGGGLRRRSPLNERA